jgi:ribosome-binding factor A
MPEKKRTDRLNSLLKEVISEVIKKDVKNPHIHELITVTQVEITKDLHHAKVFVSIIAPENEKKQTMHALQSAAGFISVVASKKVVLRYFPQLTFKLDETLDHHMRIDALLKKIKDDDNTRAAKQNHPS